MDCSPWGHKESGTTERLTRAFFGIAFLWDWNGTDFFQSLTTAEFSKYTGILSASVSQHHLLGFEIAQLEFHHIH